MNDMRRNSVFALVLTLLLAIGTLPLKVPAADGTDYEEEQLIQFSESEQEGETWKVLLPTEQEQAGYVIRPYGSTAVPAGGSFTFSLSIANGYRKGKNFAVKAGDAVLKPDPAKKAGEEAADGTKKAGEDEKEPENAEETAEQPSAAAENGSTEAASGTGSRAGNTETYTISNITGNVTVSVTGVEKTDAQGQTPESGTGSDAAQQTEESGSTDSGVPQNEEDPSWTNQDGSPDSGDSGYSDGEKEAPGEQPEEPYEDYGDGDEEQSSSGDYEDGSGDQPPYTDYEEDGQDQSPYTDYEEDGDQSPYTDYEGDGQDQSSYEDFGYGDEEQPPYTEDGSGRNYADDGVSADAVNEGAADGQGSDPAENAGAGQEGAGEENPEGNEEDPAAQVPAADTEENPAETPGEGVTESSDPAQDPKESSGESATGTEDASAADTTSEDAASADTTSGDAASADATSGDTVKETTDPSEKNEKVYPLWVGGIHASSKNRKDILGNGTAAYNDKTHILTLKEASVKSAGSKKAIIYYEGTDPLTIVLEGKNSLSEKGTASGIMSARSSLTIKGSGTLNIKTDAASSGAGICAKQGDVVISGGTVSSAATGGGAGIRALNIRIGSGIKKVQASGKKDALLAETGIRINSSLVIISPKNGKVSEDGKKIVDKDGKAASAAVIEPLPPVKVTFEAGGGSGTMEAQTVLKGKTLKLPENGFTAPECTKFNGWLADGKTYKPGTSVRINKPVTFTARWKVSHLLNLVDYTEPDCEKPGNIEYYACSVCGKLFDDSAAETEIQEKDTVIRALGHEWDETSYSWASDKSTATAKRICLRNSSHQQIETVKSVRTVVEPTCEGKGKYTYTATFTNKDFSTQKKTVELKALGHVWGKPEFQWSRNNHDCEVRLTCSRDSSHKKTVDADVSAAYTLPTRTANGKVRYTASITVNGKTVTDTAENWISPAGDNDGYRFSKRESSWRKGSKSGISFTVKRDEYDAITYKAFNGIKIDGRTVSSNYYTDEKGSLKLHLKAYYLETLSEGDHTLLVDFKDGSVDTIFRIREQGWKSPRTGDDLAAGLWSGIAAAGLAGILGVLLLKKKILRKP